MSKLNWNTDNIPDQTGQVIMVTGSTSGIGKEAARVLAGKNAKVILAVRNVTKGLAVVSEFKSEYPQAQGSVMELDLTNLSSIKTFSETFLKEYDRLNVLINNAGIMACPFSKTSDDFEIQIGTNHLGHFALTGLLLPLLKKMKNSRIVVLSSFGHKMGNIDFSDLNWEKRKYNTSKAYADSKLANLYFAYELARRLDLEGNGPMVTAAHPGWTRTDLQRHSGTFQFLNNFFSQGVEMGALPTLRAVVDENAKSGDYFGPSGFMEMQGFPVKVESNKRSHDVVAARELWRLSEELTGVYYQFPEIVETEH